MVLPYFIGTPMGRNWFYDLHEKAKHTKDWFTCVFKASQTKIIPSEELKAAKSTMSAESYAQEFIILSAIRPVKSWG